MFKAFINLVLLITAITASAQNNLITDGPYLFYRSDSLIIQSIIKGHSQTNATLLKNAPPSINIIEPGTTDVFFTVPIKKKIENQPPDYKKVENLFVTSDIEGTFDGFKKLLLAGGVINPQFGWTFGQGHLVVCGDLFDRGNEVTACLWLLYKLEEEAKAAGGYVHVIMGNHEIMNLSDDFRYVHPKYTEVTKLLGRSYAELYAPDTELGRWLRSKNIVERIGDYLFLHAGISQQVNEENLSLKKMNNLVRPLYDKDGLEKPIEEAKATVFFNQYTSPFWYRGYFTTPLATTEQIDSTLNLFDVKKIIVGHTIVDSIQTIYNGKVVAIDVNHHKQNHQALVIEKDCFYRMNADGKKTKLD